MTEDKIFELAELLADEAFGKKGMIAYSERQELTSKFNEILVKNLSLTDVSQQRKLLEWLSNEDYFNIPKDEISEILEDWETYNSNCG